MYVALTRAEEQLYLCFIKENAIARSDNNKTQNTSALWYDELLDSAKQVLRKQQDTFFSKELKFTDSTVAYKLSKLTTNQTNNNTNQNYTTLPSWLYQNAPKEPVPSLPITPSKLNFEDLVFNSPLETTINNKAVTINKGLIIHKILEQINYINNNHASFIEQWLNLYNIDNITKKEIQENIQTLLNNKDFGYIFTMNSLNEILLVGN